MRGSPQYGQLILDGGPVSGVHEIEAGSLVVSDGGRLVGRSFSWPDAPITRVVVFDVEQRTRTAASSPRRGISNPVSFEPRALIYRHWHERAGDQELRLKLDGD